MHFSSLFLQTAPQYLSNEGSTIFIAFFVTEILQFQVLPYILQILANLRQRSHEKVLTSAKYSSDSHQSCIF